MAFLDMSKTARRLCYMVYKRVFSKFFPKSVTGIDFNVFHCKLFHFKMNTFSMIGAGDVYIFMNLS